MEDEQEGLLDRSKAFVTKNLLFVGLISIGVLLLAVGIFQYLSSKKTVDEATFIPAASKDVAGQTTNKQISVDVEGSVQNPGVYKLDSEARVQDALVASGGMSSKADREYVSKHFNLAQKLTDGAKVYIPQKGEQANAVLSANDQASGGSSSLSTNSVGDNSSLININTASPDTLDTLPKVGPVTAQKIIAGRPYGSINELISKKILTQKTFDGLKDKITAE